MRKRNFNHWNKVELHDYFLNLHHMTETSVYKVSSMTATELKKCCPFLSLSHSKNQQQDSTHSHTNDALNYNYETWRQYQVVMDQTSSPLSTRGRGQDPSLLTSYSSLWLDLWWEHDYLLSNAEVNISTHTSPCWKQVVLGFKWTYTVFTYPPASFPGWRV